MDDDPVLPSYDEANEEEVPAYESTFEISARWHIIDIPARGFFGSSRSINIVHDASAIADPTKAASQALQPQKYNLVQVDNLHFEAYEVPFSNAKYKAPCIGHIFFALGHPTKANLSFTDKAKATLAINAQDLARAPIDSSDLRLTTIFQTMSSEDSMPICWSVEPNQEPVEPSTVRPGSGSSLQGGPSSSTGTHPYDASPKQSKRNWRDQFGENLKSKDGNRYFQNSGESSRGRRVAAATSPEDRKKTLGSNFKLRDAAGNVYAQFTNELFVEDPVSTNLPNIDASQKRRRAWGYLDIYDADLENLRMSYDVFQGWSGVDVQLVVLLTLFMTLEVNLRVNVEQKTPSLAKQSLLDMI